MKQFFTLSLILVSFAVNAQSPIWTKKANPQNLAINGVAFRADGQKVICGTNCHPATVRMYDVQSEHLDWNYEVPSAYLCIMGVGISSNSSYIISIEEFGNLFVFDNSGATPTLIDSIKTGTSYAFSNAISPNDQHVAIGCSDGKLKIYTLIGGQLLHDIPAHLNYVTTVSYSPNGNRIVTGGNDNLVKIWDNTGALLFTCSGHMHDITQVKVSSDNLYVVSASKDKTIKVWDINTGALLRTINAHTNWVNGIDISPDASKVVSVSSDASCKIWEISSGNLLQTFGVVDSGIINTVAWSPLGDKIATGNAKSDLSIWNVSSSLSVKNYEGSNGIRILQNPSYNLLQLTLDKEGDFKQLSIYTSTGAKVLGSNKWQAIDISSLPAGMYIVRVDFENGGKATRKFLKY